jgi:hypothetical protein
MMVYGGCVTRDAVPRLSHDLISYVARQSLISGMAPPTRLPSDVQLASAFQRKAVAGDFASSLQKSLIESAEHVDVILMDILAERFGVFRTIDGGFVTRSAELTAAKLEAKIPGRRELERFGTDKHFEYWEAAATRFDRLTSELGVKSKVLVIETPWAERDELGEATRPALGNTAVEANSKYRRYFSLLRERGFHVAKLPSEYAVAAANHKWGTSPFHYVDGAYDWIARQVREFAGT